MYETGSPEQDTKRQMDALIQQMQDLNKQMVSLHEVAMSSFVQLSRIYDVLAAQGAGANTSGIVNLLDGHEEGIILSSPPVLRAFTTSDEEESE